jgi:phosphoribosyl-ATP pyrophosphohydrolase
MYIQQANHLQLCVQVREEAGELCQTLEENEGKERAASEMADLLYHAMVLLNVQVRLRLVLRVPLEASSTLQTQPFQV